MTTQSDIDDIVAKALDHSQDWDYSPGQEDTDMLETAIEEAAAQYGIDLDAAGKQRALDALRDRLDEEA